MNLMDEDMRPLVSSISSIWMIFENQPVMKLTMKLLNELFLSLQNSFQNV